MKVWEKETTRTFGNTIKQNEGKILEYHLWRKTALFSTIAKVKQIYETTNVKPSLLEKTTKQIYQPW